MTHEILYLNRNRVYVLVNDTWYDAHKDLYPQVGTNFLVGRIEKVLSYEDYTAQYPESKQEIFEIVNEKTISGGYIRRSVEGLVKYAVNPATPAASSLAEN